MVEQPDSLSTTHQIHVSDARALDTIPDDSVDLVVTSPPYPMVEMWDDLFEDLSPGVSEYLDAGKGEAAFEAMHGVLDAVWDELQRVLTPGGIACINIGDATRTVGGRFRVYPNHARVTTAFEHRGFDPLPDILWHKPANSAAKFMGSGMIPPSAYVTLEHEYILVFRNGSRREFEPGAEQRYEAAYFWEERNRWFTDVWTEVRGRLQALPEDELRDRAAAYPFEIPYRLCSMFSVYGDTVLDPFWGTGTTSLAAMVAGRNSIGYERDPAFLDHFADRVDSVPEISRGVISERLDSHREFVSERTADGDPPDYESNYYDVPVMTSQEQDLRLYVVGGVTDGTSTVGDGGSADEAESVTYELAHMPAEQTTATEPEN